ncbi:MAG: transposase [Verrucomicrobiae bacterium]|nr:transposase [Verrucomicrobiae bacterium]
MSFIVLQRTKRGRVYAYQTTTLWNPKKKHTFQRRVYLGRLDPHTHKVIPGRQRGEETGPGLALSQLKKAVAAGGDTVLKLLHATRGKGQTNKTSQVLDASPIAEVAEPGAFHVVGQIAAATGLEATLQRVLGQRAAAQLLLLAAYQLTQATPLYLARSWMERILGATVLAKQGFCGDGDLLEQLGADTPRRMKLLREWAAQRKHPRALVYDITSISTYSQLLDLAEYGYNRDGESLAQVNLALVHDRADGLPLFYRVLPGSISDVSTLKLTDELMREFGFRDFHFVMDRGFFSQSNLAAMLNHNTGFTMAIPLNSTQARNFIRQRRASIGKAKNAFAWQGLPMHHLGGVWQVQLPAGKPAECDAHLYFDSKHKADEEGRFLGWILLVEERAGSEKFAFVREAFRWLNDNAGALKGYFSVRQAGENNWRIQRKNNAVAQRTGTMGLTLILTTQARQTREEVLADYRDRDQAEKAFDIFKNENGQSRLHISTREQAEGRLLLAFLTLIVSSNLDRRMRQAGLYKQYTTAEVFAELAKIRALRLANGEVKLLEISKKQRTLLEKLALPPLTPDMVIN